MDEWGKKSREIGIPFVIFIVVLVCFVLILNMDYNFFPALNLSGLGPFRLVLSALVFIGSVWIILWVTGHLFQKIVYKRVGSYAQVRSIWKLISYGIWAVVLVILVLGLVGDASSTTLSVGLLGAALAFALQKPLLNIAGWMFITYHRMLGVGDRVSIGTVKGFVVDIKLMHMELMEIGEWMRGDTYTGRAVLVPNGLIFEGPVYNYTRDSPFIWDEVENLVTYESDVDVAKRYMIEAATEVIGEMMSRNFERYRRMLSLQELDVALLRKPDIRMEFSDSGVKLYVLYWCPAGLRRKVKADIVERVWRKFMADPKVGIAYPHMEIVKHEQLLTEPEKKTRAKAG